MSRPLLPFALAFLTASSATAQFTPQAVPLAWATAVNAGDTSALAALYADDPGVVTIGAGRIARGPDAVRTELAGVVARARGQRMTVDSIVADVDGPTRARLVARWHVRTPPPDPRTVHGALSMALVRASASAPWRIVQDHWSVAPEAKAPVPVSAPLPDSGPRPPSQPLAECRGVKVVDGDTIECTGIGRVRLIGIDTPERGQVPFGAQATAALREMLRSAGSIRLEPDVEPRDRYQRTLAYVWADGRMANWLMARSGWAVQLTYPPNVKYAEHFSQAVRAAREERRGLWATGGFDCDPKAHRQGKC